MKNKFKGSPTFNDIADVKLRTWNRCAIMFNLMADRGLEATQAYAKQFSEQDRKEVFGMFSCIEKYGYDAIRKQIKVEAA